MHKAAKTLTTALAMLAATTVGAAADQLNALAVHIDNVSGRGGNLHVCVYNEASYNIDAAPQLERTLPAKPGSMVVTFLGLAPGTYAVKVVQDVNRNKAHDHLMLGATAEPIGYSNLVGRPSKPSFRAVQFTVKTGDNSVVVHMHE